MSSRREFLKIVSAAGAAAVVPVGRAAARASAFTPPPARVITRGPKHHWFGYYDKWEFDPTNRYVLSMQVDFEHRSPTPDDTIKIGMVDLHDDDRWIELGESSAWCWQQGCMLQWIPGAASRVLWNDREEGRYICRILDVVTGERHAIDSPVYALSPDGTTAVSTDFRRINDVRPGYGYAGLPDPHADDLAPADSGIWRIDLERGNVDLIISIREIAGFGAVPRAEPGIKHYFNHLLFNPDGSRFVFLHRWRYPNGTRLTRMITANPDGGDVRIVDDNGLTSHFIWLDPGHILAFSEQQPHGRGFFLFEDRPRGTVEPVGAGVMPQDGHCSYLPGNEWILNDTYPDADRHQRPYLYHVQTGRIVPLGYFRSPVEYTGEWRCDAHPRFSRDGRTVVIDSPHQDQGRQLHLIDISGIVG
ncbi:MAG: hypothetical protein AB7U20_10800 [Planctomycetaceae bacterium]